MKSYTVTVNGNVYDVTVEEKSSVGAGVSAPVPSAAVTVPKAAARPLNVNTPQTAQEPVKTAGAGSIPIEADAAGKVFQIAAEPGTAVKSGDTIMVLEIMKMETPVTAPKDGMIATIEVAVGDSVTSKTLLATMNA